MEAFRIAYERFKKSLSSFEEAQDVQATLELCMAVEFLGKTARALYVEKMMESLEERRESV